MEDADIPEEAVKAVAKRLKHYIEVERLEEGFDLTTSNSAAGYFHSGRGLGGSYHYNRLQDKHLHHAIENPKVKARLESMGSAQKGMLTELEKTAKKTSKPKIISSETSQFKKQKYYKKSENANLTEAAAKVLLQDRYVRTDPGHQESDEETEQTYSEYSSTSRSMVRKRSSSSLGSSGRKTSKSSSSEPQERQVKTPVTSSQSSEVDVKESDAVDGPPQSEQQDVSPTSQDQTSTAPQTVASEATVTMVPTTTVQTTPTAIAAETPAMPSAAQFPYNPQQPGFPIFYTLSPNQPPHGANILTPVFQPATVPAFIPQVSSLQQETNGVQPDTKEPVEQSTSKEAPRPSQEAKVIVKEDKSVNTSMISDATTQTPVHVQTQTDRSAVFKMSERERKKKSREAKLANTESQQDTTHNKLIQTSPQPTPLVAQRAIRPASSRSSRSKDASSRKKKESLLCTKSYSASHPDVMLKSTEMPLHSESASSMSSRRSDSAVHKKRKAKEKSKESIAKSPVHHASLPCIKSEAVKKLSSTKSLDNTSRGELLIPNFHRESEVSPLSPGDSENKTETNDITNTEDAGQPVSSEEKVVGSTSSLTAKGKDEADGRDPQLESQIETPTAIQIMAINLSDDILKAGVEEVTSESASNESKKSMDNLSASDSGQLETKVASPSTEANEEHTPSIDPLQEGEADVDSTTNSREAEPNNGSSSAVSLKKDEEPETSVSKDDPESPLDGTANGNTSPQATEKPSSTNDLDKSEVTPSDVAVNSQMEPEAKGDTKDEAAANTNSESTSEVDKSTDKGKVSPNEEYKAMDKQTDSGTMAENEHKATSNNQDKKDESSNDNVNSTAEEVLKDEKDPQTEAGTSVTPDVHAQHEEDQASEAAAKDAPTGETVSKADDDTVPGAEDKDKSGESHEPESKVQKTSTDLQNHPSTVPQEAEKSEEGHGAKEEVKVEKQTLSSVLSGSSTELQEEKHLEQNKSGVTLEDDQQNGDKPAEDHSSKESDKFTSDKLMTTENQQGDNELTVKSQEGQIDTSAEDQPPVDEAPDNRSATEMESQTPASLKESSNLSSQESPKAIQEPGSGLLDDVSKNETETNANIVKHPEGPENVSQKEGSPSVTEESGTSLEKPTEIQSADVPKDPTLEQQQDKADEQKPQDTSSTQPSVSNTTESESQPSNAQIQDESANSVLQVCSPEQSGQESITEEISSSSQDEASTTGNHEQKLLASHVTPSSDLESSITEVEESDVLTPVTDDPDTSRETAIDTDTAPPTLPTQQNDPSKTPGEIHNDSSAAVQVSTAQGENESVGGNTKEDMVDQLSDISSIITATSAEESKESEAQ